MRFCQFLPGFLLIVATVELLPAADDVTGEISVISRVGSQGAGSAEARQARDRLAKRGAEILPQLFAGMDSDNVVASNWLRTAYEEIVARELTKASPQFPMVELKSVVRESQHRGKVRRLALELLDQLEPEFGRALIPTLLDDLEFREEAIGRVLEMGDLAQKAGDKRQAADHFRKAFDHARHADQVTKAAARLKSAGIEISMIDHLGFVTDWFLLGPFDAPGYSGFGTTFPPEREVNLQAEYAGQNGAAIRWKRHAATDPLGQLNLIDAIARTREAVGYAYTDLLSADERPVELRCGADDNLTVWLNGRRVFAREQWLNGTRLDRFVAPVTLRKGKNTLLVKICQGPQHVDPQVPNNWSLQLRICGADGLGAKLKSMLPVERVME